MGLTGVTPYKAVVVLFRQAQATHLGQGLLARLPQDVVP